MKQVAVVLCGSGFRDGSEIRESVGVLWALSCAGAEARCFALGEPQREVVNCLTDQVSPGETRNQLVESARIARGEISDLSSLDPAQFDAVILPGGFGAAKNLCDFATNGADGQVHPTVREKLNGFAQASKPIGAVCIAPIIVAMVFPGKGFELTVGPESDAAKGITSLGHKHVVCTADLWHADLTHGIFTTPAYMYADAPLSLIFEGIEGMTRDLLRHAG